MSLSWAANRAAVAVAAARARTWSKAYSSIADSLKNKDVQIVYGSYKGTTRKVAERLERELKWRLGLNAESAGAEQFDFSTLGEIKDPKKALVLLLASHGDGEPTPNGEALWAQLFKDEPLPDLHYNVYGRGNSIYPHYNGAGRKVDAQLQKRGAHRLGQYGENDKISLNPEEQFFAWKETLVKDLGRKWSLKERPYKYEPKTLVTETSQEAPAFQSADSIKMLSRLSTNLAPTFAPVHSAPLASTDREYLQAKFDLSQTALSYKTGDYVVTWAPNKPLEIEIFLKALGLTAKRHDRVEITPLQAGSLAGVASYEQLAKHYIDINGEVTRELLQNIAQFAPNKETEQHARELGADSRQFYEAQKSFFNLGRLLLYLSDGVSWPVPLSFVLDCVAPLEPRHFSISSSHLKDPNNPSITAVTEREGDFSGVATGYLSGLANYDPGQLPMPIAIEPSNLRLPTDPKTPLLMIAIGTGIAPFKGFVDERETLAKSQAVGKSALFVGVRTPGDLLYKDELEQCTTLDLFPAYSRYEGGEYVQEVLKHKGDYVYDLIQKGAYIYICGDIRKLKRYARDALTEIIAEREKLTFAEAKTKIKALKKEGRMLVDLW